MLILCLFSLHKTIHKKKKKKKKNKIKQKKNKDNLTLHQLGKIFIS